MGFVRCVQKAKNPSHYSRDAQSYILRIRLCNMFRRASKERLELSILNIFSLYVMRLFMLLRCFQYSVSFHMPYTNITN